MGSDFTKERPTDPHASSGYAQPASPAYSERSEAPSEAPVAAAAAVPFIPVYFDHLAFITMVENPKITAKLPDNPAKDYEIKEMGTDRFVVASTSLSYLKFASWLHLARAASVSVARSRWGTTLNARIDVNRSDHLQHQIV